MWNLFLGALLQTLLTPRSIIDHSLEKNSCLICSQFLCLLSKVRNLCMSVYAWLSFEFLDYIIWSNSHLVRILLRTQGSTSRSDERFLRTLEAAALWFSMIPQVAVPVDAILPDGGDNEFYVLASNFNNSGFSVGSDQVATSPLNFLHRPPLWKRYL